MTGSSLKVTNVFTKLLSFGFSAISAFHVIALLTATVVHAFILHDLFPSDIAIAISEKRPKMRKKLRKLKTAISAMKAVAPSVQRDASDN